MLHLVHLCGERAIEGFRAMENRGITVGHSNFHPCKALWLHNADKLCQAMLEATCTMKSLEAHAKSLKQEQYATLHVYHPELLKLGLVIPERRMIALLITCPPVSARVRARVPYLSLREYANRRLAPAEGQACHTFNN